MKKPKTLRKLVLKKISRHHQAPVTSPPDSNTILELISYDEKKFNHHTQLGVDQLLDQCHNGQIHWINVDGLTDPGIIKKIGAHFSLHYLLVEDVLNTEHRPKTDEYEDHLFLTLKMLYKIEGDLVDYEHISFVLGKNLLLSFQEKEGDIFNLVRDRIKPEASIFRKRGSDYLLYRLVDTIVDSYYAVLENIGQKVEAIEDRLSENPTIDDFKQIQSLRKEFIYLRKMVYPLREALNKIIKNESGFIEDRTIKYFSDVYDHIIHLIDSLDTYRDVTSTMMDLYMNTINYKMNEVMKVLTIISAIFIPLSFIAGIYGMNFNHMPELQWRYGYFMVLGVMGVVLLGMIGYFRYKKWF